MIASDGEGAVTAPLDVWIRRGGPREMRSDGKRLTLLTSRAANFHVPVLLCSITAQITAARNVEIRFGEGSDCKEVSKNQTETTPSLNNRGRKSGRQGSVCFLDTFIVDG